MAFDVAEANEHLDEILEAIDDDEFEPTGWEDEFIEKIQSLLDNDKELSEDQMAKLGEIWKKVTQS